MATIRMAGNGFGGIIQGQYGTYQAASDGTFTVDTRDASSMLTLGMTYISSSFAVYNTPNVPVAATVGQIVASGSLSNGTLSISHQPDVMRPVTFEVGTGTTAVTAGSAAVTYIGNDGQTHTDTFSTAVVASGAVTQTTSYGVVTLSSVVITGVAGGTSPWCRMSTTAALSLPVGNSSVDVTVTREYDSNATIAIGSLGTSVGSIYPTTAPNGTATYGFAYSWVTPDQ